MKHEPHAEENLGASNIEQGSFGTPEVDGANIEADEPKVEPTEAPQVEQSKNESEQRKTDVATTPMPLETSKEKTPLEKAAEASAQRAEEDARENDDERESALLGPLDKNSVVNGRRLPAGWCNVPFVKPAEQKASKPKRKAKAKASKENDLKELEEVKEPKSKPRRKTKRARTADGASAASAVAGKDKRRRLPGSEVPSNSVPEAKVEKAEAGSSRKRKAKSEPVAPVPSNAARGKTKGRKRPASPEPEPHAEEPEEKKQYVASAEQKQLRSRKSTAYAKKRKELLAEGYSMEEAKEGARVVFCLHLCYIIVCLHQGVCRGCLSFLDWGLTSALTCLLWYMATKRDYTLVLKEVAA